MSRTRRPLRTTIANRLDPFLNAYSVAAAAAGVSFIALATPAAGKIVITHTSTPIPACDIFFPCPVSIDLNKDGINDFKFELNTHNYAYDFWEYLHVTGLAGAAVMGVAGGSKGPYASCLVKSAKIGPSAHFKGAPLMEESFVYSFNKSSGKYSRHLYGKWGGNHANRYLGVRFKIAGAIHYGWIRVTVDSNAPGRISATITEYGYETVANKTVKAGLSGAAEENNIEAETQPRGASLGMLAFGSDGLALWRREENVASN